jgi:hypothetical protein
VLPTLSKKGLRARCLAQTLPWSYVRESSCMQSEDGSVKCGGASVQAVCRWPLAADPDLAPRQLFFFGAFTKFRKATIDESILRLEILFLTYVFCTVTVDF